MEELRERRFDGYARVLQRAFRKYFAKRQRQKQREEAACKIILYIILENESTVLILPSCV